MSKADSIKARLRNLSKQRNASYDYLLMHYCIERFLNVATPAHPENARGFQIRHKSI